MSSFLSRPPYSWYLSVSLFSCRLFPFSNKMNPVIKQRSTFLKPILHHFSSFFSEGSRMSKKPGKQSSLHVLLCFSQVSFPSNNSLGTILSLHLPQASSLIVLPPPRLSLHELAVLSPRIIWPWKSPTFKR